MLRRPVRLLQRAPGILARSRYQLFRKLPPVRGNASAAHPQLMASRPKNPTKEMPQSEYKQQISTNGLAKLQLSEGPTELHTLNQFYQLLQMQPDKPNFKNNYFICGQHHVWTTFELYKFLMAFEAEADSISSAGKYYSDHPETNEAMEKAGIHCVPCPKPTTLNGFDDAYRWGVYQMRDEAHKRLEKMPEKMAIVLDDGYQVLGTPFKGKCTVGIEQTASGSKRISALGFPVINVGFSYVKMAAESLLVARLTAKQVNKKLDGIRKKFPDFQLKKDPQIGIVGLGNIGTSTLLELIRTGHRRFVLHDTDSEKVKSAITRAKKLAKKLDIDIAISAAKSARTAISNPDIIVGCTGNNFLRDIIDEFNSIQSPKVFFSATSRQLDGQTLIDRMTEENETKGEDFDPMEDRRFKNGFGAELIVTQLATPITFDRSKHALPPHHADLIRTLLAIANVQAHFMQKDMIAGKKVDVESFKLSPTLVQHFTKIWLDHLPAEERESFDFPNDLTDLSAIIEKSEGEVYEPFEKMSQQWLDNLVLKTQLEERILATSDSTELEPETPRLR